MKLSAVKEKVSTNSLYRKNKFYARYQPLQADNGAFSIKHIQVQTTRFLRHDYGCYFDGVPIPSDRQL